MNIIEILIYLFNIFIEYKTYIRSINFILSLLFFTDLSCLDFHTFMLLLDSLFIIYAIYIKYINPDFVHRHPLMHILLDNISSILFMINSLNFFYVLINSRQPSPDNGYYGGPGNNSSNGNNGPPGNNDNGPTKPLKRKRTEEEFKEHKRKISRDWRKNITKEELEESRRIRAQRANRTDEEKLADKREKAKE
jgi:hypothetical protein